MKIKAKLLLGVTGVVLFIMICSPFAVYLLVGKQNRSAVRHDLDKRQAKQVRDARQNIMVNKLGENLKFIGDFEGQVSITRDGYVKTATAISQLVAANELHRAAIYDRNGLLLASVQRMPDASLTVNVAYGNENRTVEQTRIHPGDPLNQAEWQDSASDANTRAGRFTGNPTDESETIRYTDTNEGFFLQTSVPVQANVYNRETEQVEPQGYGRLVTWQPLDAFIRR